MRRGFQFQWKGLVCEAMAQERPKDMVEQSCHGGGLEQTLFCTENLADTECLVCLKGLANSRSVEVRGCDQMELNR